MKRILILAAATLFAAGASAQAWPSKPIKLVGTGERVDQLEDFFPDRVANRILGMGDIVSLVEKAAETIDAEKAAKIAAKMQKGSFDLEDLRAVLPTIVSRSARLGVPPLGSGDMQGALAQRTGPDTGLSGQDAQELIAFAAGRPGVLGSAGEVTAALGQAADFHAALRAGLLPTLEAAAALEQGWTPWHAEALRFVWRAEAPHARAELDTALSALERALDASVATATRPEFALNQTELRLGRVYIARANLRKTSQCPSGF